MSARFVMHRGGFEVERNEIEMIPVPEATDTWTPVAHHRLLKEVESIVPEWDMEVGASRYAISHEGARFFGLLSLRQNNSLVVDEESELVIGVRNSHDKTYPAALVAGNHVFVCDNLAFSGEVKLVRKHTRWIERDLPSLMNRAVARVRQLNEAWHIRIPAYQEHAIGDRQAESIILRSAADWGVMGIAQCRNVLGEWRKPQHEEFSGRNAWSLYNAFTGTLKPRTNNALNELPKRTIALTRELDKTVGILNNIEQLLAEAE